MKIICQTCGQRLPKTAVMCPNCGGRSFTPEQTATPHQQQPTDNAWYTQSQPNQSVPQPAAPQPQPQSGVPFTPTPTYIPPVAPPTQPVPVTPNYQPPVYQQPTTVPPVAPQPTYVQQTHLPATGYGSQRMANTMLYAGFMRRGFAYIFDLVLVGLLLGLGYQLALPQILPNFNMTALNEQTISVLAISIYLLYMAFLNSSGRQATIGKIIMGLWVFGMQGQRIGFFHAIVREVFKLILLPLFFVMWFTARKQTLHDLLARTVVLYDPH